MTLENKKIISSELCERITAFCRHAMNVPDLRGVIWSSDLYHQALGDQTIIYSDYAVKRSLCHLMFSEKVIYVCCVSPLSFLGLQGGEFAAVEYRFDHMGSYLDERPLHLYVWESGKKKHLEKFLKAFRDKLGMNRDAEIVLIDDVFSFQGQYQQESRESLSDQSFVAADIFGRAVILEKYAFSPATSFRQRPTLKMAFAPGSDFRHQPMIEITYLRPIEQKENSETVGSRHYSCRWQVQSHYRSQWYPSEQVHKRIEIKSYIKGPDDAPLKPSRPRIYKVTR